MSLLSELKRRNVFRMALLYVVAAWVILQIADVLFEPLGLPAWTFRFVLGLLLLGFPFALVFAWIFELTPEGLRREREVDRDNSVTTQTGRKMNVVIVVLLVIAIAGVLANRLVPVRPQSAAVEAKAAEESAPEPEAASDKSIAVLPFVNMSGDPDNEYFSDGLTEELLNRLVHIGGLEVTGRTSSFAFKGKNLDLREIGRLLNVATVLEGSVRKAGNRVRITTQLIKTSDGYHLWSDSFDRELTDIFTIQEEIAGQVAEALHVTLLGSEGETPPVAEPVTVNPESYEEYLRGMYIFQRFPDDQDTLARARAHFERAIELDPNYVDAYWGMFNYWDRMNRNGHVPFLESEAEMQKFTDLLQQLAPGSDRALSAAGRTTLVGYHYGESADYLAEAVHRYPGNAAVLAQYASSLATVHDLRLALEFANRAVELDPLSLEYLRLKSFIFYRAGNCDGALEVMQQAVEIEPNIGRFRYYAAMCRYETADEIDAAVPLLEAEPLRFLHDTGLAILFNAKGDRKAAQDVVDGMQEVFRDTASYQYGQIYAQWGDPDQALTWLEHAVAIHDTGITQAYGDRLLEPLRGDPRFQAILQSAGFD